VATRLRRVFSEPERVEDIAPLVLPPFSLSGVKEVRGAAERLSADRGVWVSAAKTAGESVASSGGLCDYVSQIPFSDGLPSPAHVIPLPEGFRLNPCRISFKDGVVGFDLSFGDAVCGRVSFDIFYDDNPYFKGVEFYRVVTPELRGIGLGGCLGVFAEEFAGRLGFGYVVSSPGHPATCADVARRGYRPVRHVESRSKALFGSDGSIAFDVDSRKMASVQRILAEAEGIGDTEERRDSYTERFAETLFHRAVKGERVNYVPDYCFLKMLKEPPLVQGLDADILSGRMLTWWDYREELERKRRLSEGLSTGDVGQDMRDRIRDNIFQRLGI
jgi:GNAT superfamily N-acetyltransferase